MVNYDSWKLASPYDDEREWEVTFDPTCETELDYAPAGHVCNDNCDPDNGYHSCGWNGTRTATCVGSSDDYTRFWECPDCGTEYQDEVK